MHVVQTMQTVRTEQPCAIATNNPHSLVDKVILVHFPLPSAAILSASATLGSSRNLSSSATLITEKLVIKGIAHGSLQLTVVNSHVQLVG